MLKKYRYLDTDVYVYAQTKEKPKLLQHDRLAPLSWLRDGNSKPVAVINCSYFTNQYVLGCNQGDLRNDTHDQKGFYDLKIDTQGNYYLGQFKSWEYKDNIVAGFSPATVLIKDGKDTELISMAICDGTKLTKINPQSAIAITKDKKLLLIVSDGRSTKNRGLSGYELREFIKLHYNVELLCQLDGGGSSEMIVDGAIVNEPSDGRERNMWNGLALCDEKDDFGYVEEEFIPGGIIKQDLIDESKYGIKCPYEMKPTYITIHNTANKASAQAEINYMKSNNNEVSYHVAVDDKEAIQGIPFNRNAWHCGDSGNGKGNRNSIGVEICYSTDYETDRHEKAFMRAVEVTKYLMKKFNIPIENVVQHNHWNGKDCPHRIRKEGTWDKFIALCKEEPTLKYKIGDKVKYNRVATSAFATTDKEPKVAQGEITKVYKGANYPYLINDGLGFVNDKCIIGLVNDSEDKIKALEEEIKILKEEHQKELEKYINVLKQASTTLEVINQYASEIVKLTK